MPRPATDVEGDGDAPMADEAPAWHKIARKFQQAAQSKLKKKDKACFELVPVDGEDAKDYLARVVSAYSKSQSCYQGLALVLCGREKGRVLGLQGMKDAIFGALGGVSAVDFRDPSKCTEAAPVPAPAPARETVVQSWEAPAEELLREVQDLNRADLGSVLTKNGFSCLLGAEKALQETKPASPSEAWPSFHDIVGKDYAPRYQNAIRSKTQLVAYLEGALKYAFYGTFFRLESKNKADDAAAVLREPSAAERFRAFRVRSTATRKESGVEVRAHWHELADDELRHRIYRDMMEKYPSLKIGAEPFMLLGPSNAKPPQQTAGFYIGPLKPGTPRDEMTREDFRATPAHIKAWEKAKQVRLLLNGVGGADGVYTLEYNAWKAMGGTVDGTRETRKDYSTRGLYASGIRESIDAMRRDDRPRFSHLALNALKGAIVRSKPHVAALARYAGVDEEGLVQTDVNGDPYFVSGSGPCQLPGPLYGLERPLHIEHWNGNWVGDTAELELRVRGLEDEKFNRAEPDYAFITRRRALRDFVDSYLDHGALCFSKDDAVRNLFQVKMGAMSTKQRQVFLASPYKERSQKERYFLMKHIMAGVVDPKTPEDHSRHTILNARHGDLLPVGERVDRVSWCAVSRVPGRPKEIGTCYAATVLRQYGSGNTATFDVKFDCGYVAKGVAAGDVRRGPREHECAAPDVGMAGIACYRGTALDLDHVGLGWDSDPDPVTGELIWYRILGIRDLLDYDINRNLSGYEWAKNLDLFDHFQKYYENAFHKVGGGGLKAKMWVFRWKPANSWAYGSRS